MKKLLLPLAAILLLAFAVPTAFADAELGMGYSLTSDQLGGSTTNTDGVINFHVGWNWTILYLSWDAFAVPDYFVYNATTYVDPNTGYTVSGIYAPGFLNLFDAGLKLTLRPFTAYLEVGTDYLYIRGGQTYGNMGVNARAGLGLRFGWWGFDVSGTQVFASFNDLTAAFKQGAGGDWSALTQGALIGFNFSIYF